MADGSGLVLTDRNVWNVYSPNPPRIQWITTDKICIRTRRITASDTSDQFQYIGLDMFIGYGRYTNSIYLPYNSVSIMGYWNGDMTQPLANYSSGQDVEFILDFKKWRNNWSTTTVKDYRNLPMANPSGIPGVQAGAQMTYLDLYKIFKASSAIYFRVFHRTRWACNSESAKFTDVGYIYSGYVDNFQHPTDGHTFNNGICVYPYKPLPYVLYDKANTNMSVQIAIPWTFRQHTGSSFTAVNDYVPSNGNTVFDIAITASVVGDSDVNPNPGITGTYGPGEYEVFRQRFTKDTNNRWGYHSFNKNISEVFPESKRGKNIAFRVWYNYYQNNGEWSGWETTGPDPDRNFTQYFLAEEKCFPTMFYNRLPKFNVSQSCQVRNNTIADDYNVRWQCWDDDGDMIDFISDMYICNQAGSGVAHSYGWFSKSMSPGNYDETKNDSVLNILSHVSPNIDPSTYYNHHFELPASSADRFDAYNSNGSFAETITSPRQSSKLICPYMIDFRPSNLSITFDHTVGEQFTATIHGSHPDWNNCKFYLTAKDEDDRWEQSIKGQWGDGNWNGFLQHWENGNTATFNLSSMYGEAYRGKRFKFYVAVISPHGWDKHLGWTELKVRLNDRPRVDLGLEKTLGPTVFGEVLAADQDGVKTIVVEFCLANSNNNPDTSKLWRKTYNIHGEPYINIIEEITPKLTEYGITSNSYVGKKVFVRAGAIDSLGCERSASDMAWKEMTYDTPPDISFYLENTKGEEAFMIIKTTYPNGLPRLTITAECPNNIEKFVYNNYDVQEHQKEIRIRFSPPEHGFKDADRMKQFKFRAELTNAMGQAMVFRTENWTWNDIPTISITNVDLGPVTNGLIRRGSSSMKPIFTIRSNDSDNVRVFGEVGNNGSDNNLKSVFKDSVNAGTVTKSYTVDLVEFFKNPGEEFNFKTFRVQSADIFNKYSQQAISQQFRMLDGHTISGINIEPSSLSMNVDNNVSGKNFKVRVRFNDTPYAKSDTKSVLDLQLYVRNENKFRILYIKVAESSSYYNYIKNTCSITLLEKANDRDYVNSLNYDNLHNSYDLVIIDACYISLRRNELEKAKELADKGLPCYVIGNDTVENVFANGTAYANAGADSKWRSGIVNEKMPFTNSIHNVSLSSDSKNFYNNLNHSVFPIVKSDGKHAIFCYTSPNVTNNKVPYSKSSYVVQDNDYGLQESMFIRLVNFLIDTKKDYHRLILNQSYDITAYDSGHTCKPSDIVKEFDGGSLSLSPNQKVFAKARVRTFVSGDWDGDYCYYFEDSDKNFIYAPEPNKPSILYPITSSSTSICLKNPPIVISTGNQPNPANSQISDIRVKWNGQYYYATTHTQYFSNTASNYNNTNIVFYPPSLLNAGTNRIEINIKSKLTNIWSPTTILDIYIKDANVIKSQGEIISAYLPPRDLINELRRAYGMSNYNYPGVSNGVPITYENHVNVLNKSFNEMVDKINNYCIRKNWCTHMDIGNQIFILASSTTTINNYLTKFNK